MSRLGSAAAAALATFVLASMSLGGGAASAAAAVDCATTTVGTPTAAVGDPCWTDVSPYPFGSDGNPVTDPTGTCAGADPDCYLEVNSLAFRAWNRGIASVGPAQGSSAATTPFGVWHYNGVRWYPDPTFPGTGTCAGTDIMWAGKLDIWLVGGSYKGSKGTRPYAILTESTTTGCR